MDYLNLFHIYKQHALFGRYIPLALVERVAQDLQLKMEVSGASVNQRPLYQLEIGTGARKVLLWSQMHGNESTTTKALFDFIAFLGSDEPEAKRLCRHFHFCILPMVNPDGAEVYTRVNANGVDLNRDAVALTQPESRFLREVFETFQPDLAYNLHDQRTIFGAGDSGLPATVSFLAPAYDEARSVNAVRTRAMQIIVAMNNELQRHIPNQVGRFDDAFNLNCIGDYFTHRGVPTILFEAGHYPNDYHREFTRKMIFIALLSGLQYVYENDVVSNKIDLYLQIPQNNTVFYDFIYKNIKINYDGKEIITNFAAQYREEFIDGKIHLNAYISAVGDLEGKRGHYTYNAHKMPYTDGREDIPKIDEKADFCLGKTINFVNGIKI